MNFSLGADPEFFVHSGQRFISAIGLIPGSKYDPEPIPCGSAIQVDNVACEFNTVPATCAQSFSDNVASPLSYIEDLLKAQNYMLSREAYTVFDNDQLDNDEARMAGCEPDFCAYTQEMNTPPDYGNRNDRSVAGHVHIGVTLEDGEELALVKALDLFVTIPGLHCESNQRRQLYGKAGCYRPKEYGLEYRTPSNFWIFSDARRHWMFNQVEQAITHFRTTTLPGNLEAVINNHDIEEAQHLIASYNLTKCPEE